MSARSSHGASQRISVRTACPGQRDLRQIPDWAKSGISTAIKLRHLIDRYPFSDCWPSHI